MSSESDTRSSPCRILLLPGSFRRGSTNVAALLTAESVAPEGVEANLYTGAADLPHFNPDHDCDPLDPPVVDLRRQVHQADALLISTPEYAGALPAALKNVLEWTVGAAEIGSLSGKPTGWINVSASLTRARDAYASLAKVLGYVGASVVESACVDLPITRDDIDEDGRLSSSTQREAIQAVLRTLAQHAIAMNR
jgi:chromate reductase